jgi:nucleoside 2-deoxyribosyltransferase
MGNKFYKMRIFKTMNQEAFQDVGYRISQPTTDSIFNLYHVFRLNDSQTPVFDIFIDVKLDESTEFRERISDKIQLLLYHEIGLNGLWEFTSLDQALKFVNSLLPKISPKDKLYQLLEYLHSLADYDGQYVEIDVHTSHQKNVWRKMFFSSIGELSFYLDSLKEKNWIEIFHDGGPFYRIQLTLSGLTEVGTYLESKNSNICFVAMSFDAALMEIYTNAIQPAIIETGFIPFILHSEHVETGLTINDAMIAAIKKAKFTIADFTQHKSGVYFEAGFALGRGQKVIYTCKEGDINNAHFDTRNYQHLLWKDAADLKRKLIDKIEAYIKE